MYHIVLCSALGTVTLIDTVKILSRSGGFTDLKYSNQIFSTKACGKKDNTS